MICVLLSVCVRRVWAIPIFTLQTGLSSALGLPVECLLNPQFPPEPTMQPLGYSAQDPTSLIAELPFNSRTACLHSATVLTSVPLEQDFSPKACTTYLYLIPGSNGMGWEVMGWDSMREEHMGVREERVREGVIAGLKFATYLPPYIYKSIIYKRIWPLIPLRTPHMSE